MAFRRTSQPATPLAQLVAEALRDRKTLARQLVIGSVLSELHPHDSPARASGHTAASTTGCSPMKAARRSAGWTSMTY